MAFGSNSRHSTNSKKLAAAARRKKAARTASARACLLENLEDRRMFALLGLTQGYPLITTINNVAGALNYNAVTHTFAANSTPISFQLDPFSDSVNVTGDPLTGQRATHLQFQLTSSGQVADGTQTDTDLQVYGDIDVDGDGNDDYSGLLLEGRVSKFGYADIDTTDGYEVLLTPTGGALVSDYFTGMDIGISIASEDSTFTGSFDTAFVGNCKATIFPVSPDTGEQGAPSSIGGYVYYDKNNDGIFQSTESPIPGTTVTLSGTDVNGNNISQVATTDSNGHYLFSNLFEGDYTLTETQPSDYLDGKDTIGTPSTDNGTGVTTNDQFSNIHLPASYDGDNNNFGELKPAAIGDYTWEDLNYNGRQDVGEPAISGITATLYSADTNAPVAGVSPQVTDANGFYKFDNLLPGNYYVVFSSKAGYSRTVTDSAVATDATDSDADANGRTGNYTLVAEQYNDTVDAGYYRPAALGDFVWNDLNANGIQDAGEPGIAGVTVSLSNGQTTTTDANGYYLFNNLVPGTYTVTFPTLTGYVHTVADAGSNDATDSDANVATGLTGTYTLVSGQTDLTVDAGYYQPAALGDFVWEDLNRNGQQDAGEPGIAGVTVTLHGASGAVLGTATTDATGHYLFTGLKPGSYYVQFAAVNGYYRTLANTGNDALDSDAIASTTPASDGLTGNYTLISGQTDLTVDAGYYRLAALGDFVWEDKNANGQQDAGEPGIAGVTVSLSNGQTTTTDANGYYLFNNLVPGTYTVTFPTLSGYVHTVANVGNDASDSDANATTGATGTYTLVSGQTDRTVDAGYYKPAALGDFVWEDKNANGQQDAGEPGIAGVTVTLSNGQTAVTNASGYYLFSNLTPGTYSVTFPTLSGYVHTSANVGNDASDSDANVSTGATGTYTLVSGQTDLTVDAGYYKLAQLGDFVWEDKNANGIQDAGEPGIPNVLVTLSNGQTTTTNSSGYYLFTNLTPGTYSVTFGSVSGYVHTTADAGSNDAVDSDANVTTGATGNYTLASGDSNLTVDAGYYRLASLGDYVWEDTNKNGLQDSGEAGISGVQVQLFKTGSTTAIATATTDVNGKYLFTALTPGSYYVVFGTKTGYTRTTADVGTNDAIDSDANVSTGQTGNYTLASGDQNLTVDAGLFKTPVSHITGTKFKDITGNGLTSDDTGLAGVTIELYKDNDGDGVLDSTDTKLATTVTGAGGTYSFDGYAAGKYLVHEVTPTGWVRTAPTNQDYYAVTLTTNGTVGSLNFANYDATDCNCGLTNVYFVINGQNIVTDLRGNTNPGDTVQAYFTVRPGYTATLSLVSYTAPQSYFDANTASQQVEYDLDSGTFGPGTHSLTVLNPSCNYQVDFVCGYAIDQLGPAGSNIFYSNQNRLISADNDGCSTTCVSGKTSISGFVFLDADNDGLFETTDSPISGVTVKLYNSAGTTVLATTTTDANGKYVFSNLAPGTYQVAETQPSAYLDGKEQLGSNGGTVSNDKFSAVTVAAADAATNYNFGEITPGSIDGTVYWDADNDGDIDSFETGIAGATVTLTGTNDLGQSVTVTKTTSSTGDYLFSGLRPGTYKVTETQPSGYTDGKDTLGNAGGTAGNDVFSAIVIGSGTTAENYNFGELKSSCSGPTLCCGMTGTVTYWKNTSGQNLITCLNGSSSSTKLGNWLAATFPNLYGSGSCYATAGKTNTQVAALFKTIYSQTTLEAQATALALSIYVTDSDLAGTTAKSYGFTVSSSGTAAAVFNVGSAASALGISGNQTIGTILDAVDNDCVNGRYQGTSSEKTAVNNLLTSINNTGDGV